MKIGAGTICLKPVPDNKTAIGVPAKILGWKKKKLDRKMSFYKFILKNFKILTF